MKNHKRKALKKFIKKWGIGWLLFELQQYIDREEGEDRKHYRKDLVQLRESYAMRNFQ